MSLFHKTLGFVADVSNVPPRDLNKFLRDFPEFYVL